MSDEQPPGFDDNENNVIAMRHPDSGQPVVVPRELALKESRPFKAYNDYLQGLPWEVIATRYDYANGHAAQLDVKLYVESARSLYNSFTQHQARALQVARMEMILQGLTGKGAYDGNVPAANAALQTLKEIVRVMKLDQLEHEDDESSAKQTVVIGGTEETYVQTLEALD